MQSMCCLYGRSSQQHDIHAVVSFSKREGEEVTNVGTKAQTDGRTAGTGLPKEKVGSAQGRRVQGTYQGSRHARQSSWLGRALQGPSPTGGGQQLAPCLSFLRGVLA